MAIANGMYPFSGIAGGGGCADIETVEFSLEGMAGNVQIHPDNVAHKLLLLTDFGTGITTLDIQLDCNYNFLEFTLPEGHSFTGLTVGNGAVDFPFIGMDVITWTGGHTYQVRTLHGKCIIYEWGAATPVTQPDSWLLEEINGAWMWEDNTAMRNEEQEA